MRKGSIIFWSIFIAAAIFRVIFSLDLEPPDVGPCIKRVVDGIGIVNEDPEIKESGQVLIIDVEKMTTTSTGIDANCSAGFLLKIKTKLYPKFNYGDRISFKGKLLKPINFLNKEDPDRQFDYEGYLAKSNIYYEMKSAEVVAIHTDLEPIPEQSFKRFLFSLKRNFVNNLKQHLGEPHAALASGLVVGEKAALPSDLLMDFRIVGLIHIVVLSGYNITIVGAAIRKLLSFLPRVWGIVLGGFGIVAFGVLVGGGATVVRSCFMAGIALSADIIRRDYDVTRALIFVGLIMLIQNPMILFHDPSFQLSFLATLGLVLLAGPVEKRLGFVPESLGMRSVVAATIATQIFVSPYILYMMGNISIIGVVVNILVLPAIPITMLLVFLTGAVGMISFSVANVISWFTQLLLSYELFMVETFARLPFASVHIPAFSKWWVVGFYVVFALIYWDWWSNMKFFKFALDAIKYIRVLIAVKELSSLERGQMIERPSKLLYVARISNSIAYIMNTSAVEVYISRRAIKHIIERRGDQTKWVFDNLPKAIRNPTKIVANSNKKEFSYILANNIGRIIGVVVETKTPDYCQVISAYPIDKKTYRKLVDISGRAEFPPFGLP